MARITTSPGIRAESIFEFVDDGKQNMSTNDDAEHDADDPKADD
jgi:hypothetical protein